MAYEKTGCKQHFDCYCIGTYHRRRNLDIRRNIPIRTVQIYQQIIARKHIERRSRSVPNMLIAYC